MNKTAVYRLVNGGLTHQKGDTTHSLTTHESTLNRIKTCH